ncbi:MAG TPA: methyltransferase domain-containing protein [Flavipsychrobacter sp.]|nr:methyltransferase domain-containing protein [Flavipsychrobacter sp.]
MRKENNYIIEGGAEGKKRLDVLSEVLNDHSLSLITSGISLVGKSVLELGCGGGNLTRTLARQIGDSRKVTAIDFDGEILALAKEQATNEGIRNINFIAMDAYQIAYVEEFDIVYTRFLLSHLKEPLRLLEKMIQALKPGGKIIIEDIDFSGHFCFPPSPAFNTYQDLFIAAATNNGQNPHIGLSLFSLLNETDLHEVNYEVFQPSHRTGKGKWMAYHTMDKIKDTVIKQNLATQDEVSNILRDLELFTRNENTILSLPRVFGAWGYKPD